MPASESVAVNLEFVSPYKISLKWSQPIGEKSHLHQLIHISAIDSHIEFETRVNWAENRKFLKVEFPVEVHSTQVRNYLTHI